MIKRILTIGSLLVFINVNAFAKVTHLNYEATFGILGSIGTIKNRLTKHRKTYEIDTTVRLTGLAKMLMGEQIEHYVSKGHIKNGLMISHTYKMVIKNKDSVTSRLYVVHHKGRYVTKRYQKWVKGKLVEDKKTRLSFYAKDDLLTLYFNIGHAIKKKGRKYIFKAVGLEKQNGKVLITVPSDTDNASYEKDLGKGASLYAKALIVQKNFKNKKGDILLAVEKDGFIKKSVIKDVLFYGDVRLVRED